MRYEKPFVIAEAGCNHKGEMEIAHELINTAAIYCKADAIKFQKRCPKELLTLTLKIPTARPMENTEKHLSSLLTSMHS